MAIAPEVMEFAAHAVKVATEIHAHADGMAQRMPRGMAVTGTWPCPKCGKVDGIRWRIAKDRHLHAACVTDMCLNFME